MARNPVEATSHAQLMGYIVGRVEAAPGEADAPAAPERGGRRKRRRTSPAMILALAAAGLALGAGGYFGVQGYIANIEAGLPPPEELRELNAAREARKGSGEETEPEEPALPADPVPKVALGQSIKLGNTTFTPRRVLLGPVSGEEVADSGPSRAVTTDQKLMLLCTVRNDSASQVYSPIVAETARAGFVRDGSGRLLAGFVREAGGPRVLWDGQSFDELGPGEESTNLLICDLPADSRLTEGPEGLVWRAHVLGSNTERRSWVLPTAGGVADVTFSAAEIERSGDAPRLDVVRSGPTGTVTEPAFARRRLRIGGEAEVDGVRVRITGIRRAKEIDATRPGPDGSPRRWFTGPFLVMDLRVENTTDRPLAPMTRRSVAWCDAVDQHGNTMAAQWTTPDNPFTFVGQHTDDIGPGLAVDTLLVVAAPKVDDPGLCAWSIRILAPGEADDQNPRPRRRLRVEFSMPEVKD